MCFSVFQVEDRAVEVALDLAVLRYDGAFGEGHIGVAAAVTDGVEVVADADQAYLVRADFEATGGSGWHLVDGAESGDDLG